MLKATLWQTPSRLTEMQSNLPTRCLTGWATLNEGLSSVIPSWDFQCEQCELLLELANKKSTMRYILIHPAMA